MKNLLFFVFLFSALLGAPFYAQAEEEAAPAAEAPAAAEDPLKDIVIHQRPHDFESAQQLAVQNREERVQNIKDTVDCIQRATSIDGISACQAQERKILDKIWLSYCDTSVSYITNWPGRTKADAARQNKRMAATECERAMSAVTGKPMNQQ